MQMMIPLGKENDHDVCEDVLQTRHLLMELWEHIRRQEIQRCQDLLQTLQELYFSTKDPCSRQFWARSAKSVQRRWYRLCHE